MKGELDWDSILTAGVILAVVGILAFCFCFWVMHGGGR